MYIFCELKENEKERKKERKRENLMKNKYYS
jgi:hypothetical protein